MVKSGRSSDILTSLLILHVVKNIGSIPPVGNYVKHDLPAAGTHVPAITVERSSPTALPPPPPPTHPLLSFLGETVIIFPPNTSRSASAEQQHNASVHNTNQVIPRSRFQSSRNISGNPFAGLASRREPETRPVRPSTNGGDANRRNGTLAARNESVTLNLADSVENADGVSSSHEVLLKTSANIKESFVITARNNMIFIREKHFDPAHHKRLHNPAAPAPVSSTNPNTSISTNTSTNTTMSTHTSTATAEEANKNDTTSDFYFQTDDLKNRSVREAQSLETNPTKKVNLIKQLKQRINAEKQGNFSTAFRQAGLPINYLMSDGRLPAVPNYVQQYQVGIFCSFETKCDWTWDAKSGFRVTSADQLRSLNIGPKFDASNNNSGHFLFLQVSQTTHEIHVISPRMQAPSGELCRLELFLHQGNMNASIIKVVGETAEPSRTQWIVHEMYGNSYKSWQKYKFKIGRVSQEFKLILEVIPHISPAHIALDNIRLVDCYPEPAKRNMCVPYQFRCASTNMCINVTQVCDISRDCRYGEDELQDCDKMPLGSRCDFEDGWCGWQNDSTRMIQWIRHYGSTPTNRTGPTMDHTHQNSSGHYLLVNMAQSIDSSFAATATVRSPVFNPPPTLHSNESSKYHNSCSIRFYYHQYGVHKSGLALMLIELTPKENITSEIWWSFADNEDKWRRAVVTLPNITYRYYLQFNAKKGLRYLSAVAVDDISVSPECFGLNIPTAELHGYNYWIPPDYVDPSVKATHKDFVNKTYYEFTPCGAIGRLGPTQENCTEFYRNSPVEVEVLQKPPFKGIQKWLVPGDGHYTIIAKGASGGKGSGAMGSSRGAIVRAVMELHKGERLYFLIGQEGLHACVKSLGRTTNSSCQAVWDDNSRNLTGVRGVLNMMLRDGGGGGGGATYVFLLQRKNNRSVLIPLIIAGGGGGLGLGRFVDNDQHHGQAINMSRKPYSGQTRDRDKTSGAGGGWTKDANIIVSIQSGYALEDGGVGGAACYDSRNGAGSGGFGGGGGGCTSGGGGGGYTGGNSWTSNATNGEGGTSYITPHSVMVYSEAWSGQHTGSGAVIIVPSINECGCDYQCLALDENRAQVTCICPPDWVLGPTNNTCINNNVIAVRDDMMTTTIMTTSAVVIISLTVIAIGLACIILYNRHQRRKSDSKRHKMLTGPELQLNRLRMQSDSMMTEYNPNYEFGGVIYTLKDLQDIPRDQLRLVKALGQGAFGEVYQGFYKARQSDAVEMPVAVKTLPEMSTQQAEIDFLMEALIMSKFNHPNIVHFIGVCFDKHPRFIVLELLAGGDLKNFLRESRPKPERSSPLTMKDLVLIAIDVAKGCKYMEDHRFIHRDIAARNCLLTTKGPGRVVKIADFGMSRDIYRSDYYRKGGKAMLPIKWMPPEAFLDGIFTSKTDVWSFGVLLWEIMSMGYMPYTGCANRQVMQLVTSGGRLEPPSNCPGPVYGIMTQCWHPNPELRPSFGQLLERLGYCIQDPDVLKNPLPVFTKAPSAERDATVMRPKNSDDSYLQIPHTADYLVPTPTTPCDTSEDGSFGTMLNDTDESCLDNSWETSFMLPQSKSTQPLLQDNIAENVNSNSQVVDNLISIDSPQLSTTATPKAEPALMNHENHTFNNNIKAAAETNSVNLKSGIALDASNLIQQTVGNQKKPYANVIPGSEFHFPTQNGPYTIDTNRHTNLVNNRKQSEILNKDSEISC